MPSTSPIILVTGGSKGLGLAIVESLLTKYHARVSTISRSVSNELVELSKTHGENLLLQSGDISKPQDCARAVDETVKKYGALDGLVLNASSLIQFSLVGNVSPEQASEYLTTNIASIFHFVTPAMPHLRKTKGKIVMVSSGASESHYRAWGMYCAGKAFMNSLAGTLAAEERENGVSVWSIRAGVNDTQFQAHIRDNGAELMEPRIHKIFTDLHAGGKLRDPKLPGGVLAGAVIDGPVELSGQYLDWGHDALERFRD